MEERKMEKDGGGGYLYSAPRASGSGHLDILLLLEKLVVLACCKKEIAQADWAICYDARPDTGCSCWLAGEIGR